jgi:hypothetical protein
LDPKHQLAGSWNSSLIDNNAWLAVLGGVTLGSLVVAVIVYLLGVNTARRAAAAANVGVAS